MFAPRLLSYRSFLTKYWGGTQSGERDLSGNGSGSLPLETPEQENIRLRPENAHLQRLMAVHGIPISQFTLEKTPPAVNVQTAPPVDKEERVRNRVALF